MRFAALIFAIASSLSGCGIVDSYYENLTVEELVTTISTPREAQLCLMAHVEYAIPDAYPDTYRAEQFLRRHPDFVERLENVDGKRKMSIQSLAETHDRGWGVCIDTALAVIAMLRDDGYPPIMLQSHWKGLGHAVFAWQGNNGKWGSSGKRGDYRLPIYDSLEDLARAIARSFGEELWFYAVYDFSLADTIHGMSEGLVVETFFSTNEVFIENGEYSKIITSSLEKVEGGYLRKTVIRTSEWETNREVYSHDDFSFWFEGEETIVPREGPLKP